jgi:SOS response regulatory protein OraA/RecX
MMNAAAHRNGLTSISIPKPISAFAEERKNHEAMIAKGYPHALIFDILQSYDDDNSEYTAYYEKLIDKKLLLLKAKGLSEQIIKQKLMAHFRPKGAPSELICERIQKILH